MGSILLVVHLMTAIFLVAIILMQRSGGGALNGLGGGSGANSFLSARGTGNLLTRLTAILATIFFVTSISLCLYYRGAERKPTSVVQSVPVSQNVPDVPTIPLGK
ncbi:MAG: preprotein translocase subunit SecG [Alphaproteobacteria bacterium]|nr:preprotein translocase subunit SecG [Alphaproteobacteria bacterium]